MLVRRISSILKVNPLLLVSSQQNRQVVQRFLRVSCLTQSRFPIMLPKHNIYFFSSENAEKEYLEEKEENEESTIKSEVDTQAKAYPDKSLVNRLYLYKFILNRVTTTCTRYLRANKRTKSRIGPESRYYYVKQRIDKMSPEQQKAFFEYLKKKNEFFKGSSTYMREIRRPNSAGEMTAAIYQFQNFKMTKGAVNQYLEVPEHGPILRELILVFLDKENPDYKWYLNPHEDERKVGVVAPIKHTNKEGVISKTRLLVDRNLDAFRARFQNLEKLVYLNEFRAPSDLKEKPSS